MRVGAREERWEIVEKIKKRNDGRGRGKVEKQPVGFRLRETKVRVCSCNAEQAVLSRFPA